MLHSVAAIVSESGYGQMSVSRITGRAGVSRRTFYDVFEDREDCFMAAFEDAVARAQRTVLDGYEQGRGWREKIRSALAALLWFFDDEPEVGSLLVVDALQAGPRVLRRRVEILEQLSCALRPEDSRSKVTRSLPPLTGEGVVGAVLGVIHTRLLTTDSGAMVDLLNPLMGMIVLPYLGSSAAQQELELPTPERSVPGAVGSDRQAALGSPLAALPMRITYRTLAVLNVVGERPNASNREVAERAGVADQGQISRLLARLDRLGLVCNTGQGQPSGEPNAWRLTGKGQEIHESIQARSSVSDGQSNVTREPHSDVDRH
jgi:AcrR family transcriptional regulator/DNA-binding MarR family transcriptional regulator